MRINRILIDNHGSKEAAQLHFDRVELLVEENWFKVNQEKKLSPTEKSIKFHQMMVKSKKEAGLQ